MQSKIRTGAFCFLFVALIAVVEATHGQSPDSNAVSPPPIVSFANTQQDAAAKPELNGTTNPIRSEAGVIQSVAPSVPNSPQTFKPARFEAPAAKQDSVNAQSSIESNRSQNQMEDLNGTKNQSGFSLPNSQRSVLAPFNSGRSKTASTPPATMSSVTDPLEQNDPWINPTPINDDSALAGSPQRFDPTVQAATYVDLQSQSQMSATARQVLGEYDVKSWTAELPGDPVSLTEALAMTPMETRPELIRAYWNVFEKWATHVTAQREAQYLSEITVPQNALEKELLSSAQSLVKARIIEAEMELEASQQRLAQIITGPQTESLPLPNDLPLVDEYLTKFETLGQWTESNPRLSQIDRRLPKSLDMIRARADAALRTRSVVEQAIPACNRSQMPLGSALEAVRLCRESHFEFLRSVSKYNMDIAEYALSVAPFGQPAEQVVAMLIKRQGSMTAVPASVAAADLRPRTASAQPVSSYSPEAVGNLTQVTPTKKATSPWDSSNTRLTDQTQFGDASAETQNLNDDTTVSSSATSEFDTATQQVPTNPSALQPRNSPPINPLQKGTGGGGSYPFGSR